MRLLILLFLLPWKVHSRILRNFTAFEEGVKNFSPFLGPLNRTVLTHIVDEIAWEIDCPDQEHIDLCTSRITTYLAIQAEFRSLDYDAILSIGNVANSSLQRTYEEDYEENQKKEIERFNEEMSQFLPFTFEFLKTQLNELRKLNATEEVITFVQSGFFRMVDRFLAEHGIWIQLRSQNITDKKAYIKQKDRGQEDIRRYWRLKEDDIAIINKVLCYDILNWKTISLDRNILNVEKEVIQAPLNFTRLIEGIEQVSPDFGPVNRMALKAIVDEKASEIGISMQEHVDACADTVTSYLKIRDELRNLSDVEILAVDRISNEFDKRLVSIHKQFYDLTYDEQTSAKIQEHKERRQNECDRTLEELNRYLPATVAYTKAKMSVLRSINASSLVSFVQSLSHVIVDRFLSERGFNIASNGEVLGRDALLERMEQISAYNYLRDFEKGEQALLNQYLCYGILNGREISSRGQFLDFERKLIEEPLNFAPIIEKLKSIHPTFESIDRSFLKEDFIKEASSLGIYDKEYLRNCTNCITGYLNITQEHKSIEEKERNAVQQILNRTDAKLEELIPYLPVTVEFLIPKMEEMKKIKSTKEAIDFVHWAALLLVQRNVVEKKMKSKCDCEADIVPFIVLKRLAEIDDRHRALSKENRAAVNRLFCYDFLRTKIIEGIVKWT